MKNIKIISLLILTLGIIMLFVGVGLGLSASNVKEFFTNTHKYTKADQVVITEEINKIDISSDIRYVNITSISQDEITIDYYEEKDEKFEVTTDNNELKIEQKKKNKIFNFGF